MHIFVLCVHVLLLLHRYTSQYAYAKCSMACWHGCCYYTQSTFSCISIYTYIYLSIYMHMLTFIPRWEYIWPICMYALHLVKHNTMYVFCMHPQALESSQNCFLLYIHTCLHTHLHTHTLTHIPTHTHAKHKHTHTNIYIYIVRESIYIYIYTCTYCNSLVYMHTHHVHTHHVHTHTGHNGMHVHNVEGSKAQFRYTIHYCCTFTACA